MLWDINGRVRKGGPDKCQEMRMLLEASGPYWKLSRRTPSPPHRFQRVADLTTRGSGREATGYRCLKGSERARWRISAHLCRKARVHPRLGCPSAPRTLGCAVIS